MTHYAISHSIQDNGTELSSVCPGTYWLTLWCPRGTGSQVRHCLRHRKSGSLCPDRLRLPTSTIFISRSYRTLNFVCRSMVSKCFLWWRFSIYLWCSWHSCRSRMRSCFALFGWSRSLGYAGYYSPLYFWARRNNLVVSPSIKLINVKCQIL